MNNVRNLNIDDARNTYERFLLVFPTASKFWREYVTLEISAENYQQAGELFGRCLISNLHVELWQSYLTYVRKLKDMDENRGEIIDAYEFALQYIGLDVNATSIWNEYLSFLKSLKFQSQFDTTQNLTKIRMVYQRAIANPMNGIDNLLKDYENFELDANPNMAKGLVQDISQKYKIAVTRLMERKKLRDGILINVLAVPYQGTYREDQQLGIWKTLILTEIRNYKSSMDAKKHISFVFRQALLSLYHYPEIWHMYAQYFIDCGHLDDAAAIYDESIKAHPTNVSLSLLYASFEESRKNYEKARDIFEKLVEYKHDAIIWIQFMRFANRNTTCGTTAGKVFLSAKKTPGCTYHVFLALAQIEWEQNNKPDVARKLFELGLKEHLSNPIYANEYLKFLEHLNDKSNARLLFEKLVVAIPKPKSLEFWNKFVDFEYRNGDKDTIAKVLRRRGEAYPEHEMTDFQGLISQFQFGDLNLGTKNSKKIPDILSKVVQFVRPDLSQMVKIDIRSMTHIKRDGSLPDPVDRLLSQLPKNYDGVVPDVDHVIDTLVKNELPLMESFEEGMSHHDEFDDEDHHHKQGGSDEGDLWIKQQMKKKRKFQ